MSAPFLKRGFTLIELLVGIVIMSVILGLGAASYRTFQKSQQLNQATQDLITNLRYAQSLSLSGNKPVGCGNIPFLGYEVNIVSGGYTLFPFCSDGITTPGFPASKTVTFPNGVTATASPISCIEFYALNKGVGPCGTGGANIVQTATTITLTNSQNGQQKSISINQAGEINEQ